MGHIIIYEHFVYYPNQIDIDNILDTPAEAARTVASRNLFQRQEDEELAGADHSLHSTVPAFGEARGQHLGGRHRVVQ